MRSKKKYSQFDADSIRELLKEKSRASRSRQKTIRGNLRKKYQFYISDFTMSADAFNHYNFDNLIKTGRISILDGTPVVTKIESPIQKKDTSHKQNNSVITNKHTIKEIADIEKITWGISQNISNFILADGIETLKNSPVYFHTNLPVIEYGNYLISHDDIRYIGESKEVTMRVRNHFSRKTGFYYKNYLNKYPMGDLSINDFTVQIIDTKIGRKELEEFGIVNLPAILNKAHRGGRDRISGNPNKGIWNIVQINSKTLIEEGEQALMEINFLNWQNVIADKIPVIYWIEHSDHGLIYIGETYDMKKRFKNHSEKTYSSALRRHIGTDLFGFEFIEKYGKKSSFTERDDLRVNAFLKQCEIRIMSTNFGRRELEEFLIRKHRPLLNRKENK